MLASLVALVFETLNVQLNVEPLSKSLPVVPDTLALNKVPVKVVVAVVFKVTAAGAPVLAKV
ncbi:MAG TPA: hypothetical protein PKW06_07495, partial [Cyclobacteriaceae bacterium]|nr:hypothetical protein [Cyclobacteriaceae bacterium]